MGASLGGRASEFVAGANQAFVDAMSIGMRVSVVVVVFAAVVVWRFLPARAPSDTPQFAPIAAVEPEITDPRVSEFAGAVAPPPGAMAPVAGE